MKAAQVEVSEIVQAQIVELELNLLVASQEDDCYFEVEPRIMDIES